MATITQIEIDGFKAFPKNMCLGKDTFVCDLPYTVAVDNGLSADKLVMQCYTSDRNPNRFMQSLTIDTKTYLPLELVTYNAENKPVIEVRFQDFKRNVDIDDKIFN